ncbi:hypothetical protein QBC40DRAFT_286200 [Triangularia verruculosa]|uniref:Protein kinase domain-containing protein n=1 Tax=Triangularia verruculosa TaxID=2587418 RepID=A0AAN6XEI3_9PEZI|nr:hypothetical protein QBC40DRAFT_286200 [Triangularia verruculosa]
MAPKVTTAAKMREPKIIEFGFDRGSVSYTPRQAHFDVSLYNLDTRSCIWLEVPWTLGNNDYDDGHDDLEDDVLIKIAAALREHLDNRAPTAGDPPQNFDFKVKEYGILLTAKTNSAGTGLQSSSHHLLEEYQLPSPINSKTVLRSELTEIRRLFYRVDLVEYSPSLSPPGSENGNRAAFKYEHSEARKMWTEIHILARLPPHPHLALLERLVLDELTQSRLVGFTMRYIANKPLDKSRPAFKLKWLRQLMQTIDDLNLKHGILHQDVADRNLIIDPDTDSIVLIDFNFASRLGLPISTSLYVEGTREGQDDVKGVAAFMYEYITRDPALGQDYALGEVDESSVMDSAKWVKHPSVELDAEVAEFYSELKTWVHRRRTGVQLTHYTQAPEHLEWPSIQTQSRAPRGKRGKPACLFLNWGRPSSAQVDPTRRLLATGRYADEEEAGQAADRAFAAECRKISKKRLSEASRLALSDVLFLSTVPPGRRVLRSGAVKRIDGAAGSRPATKGRGKRAGKVQGRKG